MFRLFVPALFGTFVLLAFSAPNLGYMSKKEKKTF
jgi:hypothetical protein